MKSTGMIRRVDELGRIVLPVEIRRSMDISVRDAMEIYLDNDRIVLQKYSTNCVFCGSTQDLVRYHGKHLCQNCMQGIAAHR